MPGDRPNERWAHSRFDHLHVDGEWFLLTDELADFIRGLKSYAGALDGWRECVPTSA